VPLAPPDSGNIVGDWELAGQLTPNPKIFRQAWIGPTVDAMAKLPMADDWASGARRTHPTAIAKVVEVLFTILDDCTPAPAVVPTWNGGVQVEWHRNEVDLEIEASPQGLVEYYFKSPNEEHEGAVDNDFHLLNEYVRAVNISE
jgi:hypothetical protein